jgi:hypothetical protein
MPLPFALRRWVLITGGEAEHPCSGHLIMSSKLWLLRVDHPPDVM